MNRVIIIIIGLLFLQNAGHANNFIRLINTDNLIDLVLTSQNETLLEFDFDLSQVGTSNNIVQKVKTQFIDNRLWITALEPFNSGKLLVKDTQQQIRAIFLISATSTATNQHYKISQKRKTSHHKATVKTTKQLNYIDMTRFLAQKLYAPQRLIKDIGLKRIPINPRAINLFACSLNMTCNGNVKAVPIFQYTDRNHQYYAIAIKLSNQTHKKLVLDPRDIIGKYLSVSFQFNNLQPKNTDGDVSVVYLISHWAHP